MSFDRPQESLSPLSGAGGSWRVIDEMIDPAVVSQDNEFSCGPACAQMLLKDQNVSIPQTAIAFHSGMPTDASSLARALNHLDTETSRLWGGGELVIPGTTPSQLLEVLSTTGAWIAVLWEEGARIGHFVVVDGLDETGKVMIRDPQGKGTRYKMEEKDFLQYWNQQGVYLRRQ